MKTICFDAAVKRSVHVLSLVAAAVTATTVLAAAVAPAYADDGAGRAGEIRQA